ncbi:MAG: hypothetical protein IJN46_03835 [Lachnospiraceae bacterium]|nr:hypothetical protein [Lachnospiraceae bacterium]
MTTKNTHIFDKVFKKILTLSTKAVINLINGLFETDYPEDSTITYNWTEFMDTELRRTLADTIITINNRYSYHIEAQLEKDEDIVFRVFEYGFHHADHRRASTEEYHVLHFPEPKIIYLYSTKDIPNTYTLRLDFGGQGYFDYKVPVFKYLETSLEELNQKKLIVLIPFQLLKLRKLLQKNRSPENLQALQYLIEHDILDSIETNYQSGNISINDAYKLQRLTKQLYNYIYAHYAEMEELNDMTDESLLLDIDILEMKYEKKLAELDSALAEKNSILAKMDSALAEKDSALAEKDSALAEKDSEIQRLKAELQRLQQR